MSWTHHLVFLPLAVLLLADLAAQRRDPVPAVMAVIVYALSVTSPIWLAPQGVLLENTFTLMMAGLIAFLPLRINR
jgi:hypothetical protein